MHQFDELHWSRQLLQWNHRGNLGRDLGRIFLDAWTVTPSPNPSNDQNGFYSVSCTDSTACTAVGSIWTTNPRSSVRRQNLIETWNGTLWSVAVARNEAANFKEALNGVTCTVLTACVAAGSYQGESTYVTLIQSSLAITTTYLPDGTLSHL